MIQVNEDHSSENSSEESSGQPQADTIVESPELAAASEPFVGRWNHLVSTSNWEKGRIIIQWRTALEETGADVTEFSDEAWSRRVGGVTSQHVGRLRRVYHRFGENFDKYEPLYWSHFFAALDWEDAEMWLEGAIQSGWSVSAMRRERWQTVEGGDPASQPKDNEIVSTEKDEDFEPATEESPSAANQRTEFTEENLGPRHEGPDFGDEDDVPFGDDADDSFDADPASILGSKIPDQARPFEHLGELPEDMADALESFKLSIIRHKSNNWEEISLDDTLAVLDALKFLAMAEQ